MHNFFSGWYMKCESGDKALAVIPAVHQNGGKRTCSIQLITEDRAWSVELPEESYRRDKNQISIGENRFCEKGMKLSIHTPELSVKGMVKYDDMKRLRYDIMGPFVFMPFMECRHKVFSMFHEVNGTISMNGKRYDFKNGRGYWEGDSGMSFPKEYLWTQCFFDEGSLMLSVAVIPMFGMYFTGVIGVIWWQGREYRLATYLGARVSVIRNGVVMIEQGNVKFEARLMEDAEKIFLKETVKELKAPMRGQMIRSIHENIFSKASYRFQIKNRTVFAFKTDRASFEYEYNR